MSGLVWRQFAIEWKLYARDRTAMFWTFAFPVLIFLAFGTIFGSGRGRMLGMVRVAPAVTGARDAALDAALLRAMDELQLKVTTLSAAEAEARWKKGDTAAMLEPLGDGYRLRLNAYLMQQAGAVSGLVNRAFLIAQARLSGAPEPQGIPSVIESPGGAAAASYAAFLLPGLLGLNLVSMGLFTVGMVNVAYREKGKFRRLAVTPLPKWVFLLGQVLHRLTVVALQTALVLAVGRFLFGIENQGSAASLVVVLFLGTACFMAIGFALSSVAETTEAYAPISNLVFFPMMLLSGVYFSLDQAPRWLQVAVQVLPLSPYLKALRAVFNDGAALATELPLLAVVAGWTAIAFWAAVRRFRWV